MVATRPAPYHALHFFASHSTSLVSLSYPQPLNIPNQTKPNERLRFVTEMETRALLPARTFENYELKYESDDEYSVREESSDDTNDNANDISLHYSKEDVHALAVKAEQLVLLKTREKRDIIIDTSSDSDYESKQSRECFISSEPNIYQRRTSPCRKRLNSRRKDWRNSLPECLEYFTPNTPAVHDSSPISHSGLSSKSTTGLSDLWEQVNRHS